MPYLDVHAAAFAEGAEPDPALLKAEYEKDEQMFASKIRATEALFKAEQAARAKAEQDATDAKAANYDLWKQVGAADADPKLGGDNPDDPDEYAKFDDDFLTTRKTP